MLSEDTDSLGKEIEADEGSLLVFVDFSEGAECALLFAADLAADLGAQLYVVHVIHDPADEPGYYRRKEKKRQKTLARMADSASEMMASFLEDAAARCQSREIISSAETMLLIGTPVRRMLEVTERLKPRLVVIGSRGRTNLSKLLVGSKAAQFVRLSTSPVLVVKE